MYTILIEAIESSIKSFKLFLETRGHEFSDTETCLPFFALVHVPDPRVHPCFKNVFASSWKMDLKERITNSFLLRQKKARPKLLDYISASTETLFDSTKVEAVSNAEVAALKQTLQDTNSQHQQTLAKLKHVQVGYHQVIGIAAELAQSLAVCINGEQIAPTYLADIVKRLSSLRKSSPSLPLPEMANSKAYHVDKYLLFT
jgi:hypothetical protein